MKKRIDVIIIGHGFNRRNGANGSLMDLFLICNYLGYEVIFVTYKRSIMKTIIDVFLYGSLKWFLKKKIISIRALENLEPEKSVFFCTNLPSIERKRLRTRFSKSIFVSFQTGDVPEVHQMNEDFRTKVMHSNFLFFQSPGHMEFYMKWYSESIYARPYLTFASTSIEKVKFGNNKHEALVIYCGGSIQPRKNQLLLIDAFTQLMSSSGIIGAKLVFSGALLKDNYPEFCNEFISRVTQNSRIEYIGNIANYQKFMAQCAVVVSCSYEEGLSTIIREAMCLNRCIVASDISGNRGTLFHKQNALLFNDLAEGRDLVDLLSECLINAELRKKLGTNAGIFYRDNLSVEKYSERIDEFLMRLSY